MARVLEELTERQREVLRLVARGHTNGEIAALLGISLDGAKWHVSEIITRLGVSSRDEAAEAWLTEHSTRRRIARLAGPLPWPVALGAAAFAVAAVVGLVAVLALWRGQGSEPPLASPSETATSLPGTTPTEGPPGPTPPAVTGLFTEPREREPDRVVTLDFPESPFPEWDGNAVIYDIANGETIDLGQGAVPIFNPAGTMAAWVAGDVGNPSATTETRLIDLATREQRLLGPGDGVWWEDDTYIAFGGRGNRVQTLNLATGELTPGGGSTGPMDEQAAMLEQYGYWVDATSPRGNSIWNNGFPVATWSILDSSDQPIIADIDAFLVRPVDRQTIVVATEVQGGGLRTNVFLVDLATRRATFVASTGASVPNWPLDGSDQFLVWAEDFCGQRSTAGSGEAIGPRGDVFVFDRANGSVTRLLGLPELAPGYRDTYALMTDADSFALGSFGFYAIVNAATLDVEVRLPVAARSWTADRAYAGMGWYGGHGGLCP